MFNTQNEELHCSALVSSVLCMSIYDGLRTSTAIGARSYFFVMFFNAVLAIIFVRLYRILCSRSLHIAALLLLLFSLTEIAETIAIAISLWSRLYSGSAGWLFVFFLLFLFWRPSTHAINSTGWILRWCILFALIAVGAGVFSQLRWQRLSFDLSYSLSDLSLIRIHPEYLAISCLTSTGKKKDITLPLADSAVRFFLIFLAELIFGSTLTQYLEHGELLRAWGMGIFSRSDSLVLAVWLMLTMYRVLLLSFLVRHLKENIIASGRAAHEP